MSVPRAEVPDAASVDALAASMDVLAAALIAGKPAPPDLDDSTRLALAWRLHALCYAAWSSAPETTDAIAVALHSLTGPLGSPAVIAPPPVMALAEWTDGIAAIVRGDMAAALSALERSANRWRELGDTLHEARTQVPRIAVLAMLGRFDDAAACGDAARAALEAAGDAAGAARVSLNLGSLAVQRDQYAQALPHYRAASASFARSGDHEHSVMADIGLANALGYLGDFAEAELIFGRAAHRAERHALPVLSAGAGTARALIDLARGDFGAALARLEASRRAFEAMELTSERMETEKSLADAYLELRLLPEAEALYGALETALSDTPQMPTLPWIRLQRARVAAMSARDADARALLDSARIGFAAQGNAVGEAQVALLQAQVQIATGDASALETSARAAEAFQSLGLTREHAAARVVHADALLALGRCDAAVAASADALENAGPQTSVQAWTVQGEALLDMGRPVQAREALDAAIDTFDALRERIPGGELRRAYLSDVMRPYRRRLAMALDDAARDPASLEAAFDWLERFKARTMAERSLGALAPAVDERSTELRMRLDWIHRHQQEQLEESGEASALLHTQAIQIEGELLETRRRAAALEGAGPAAPDAGASPRDALGADQAIVEYGVIGDELFAFVVDRGGITLHRRLGSWREVVQAVQGLRFQIETLRGGHAVLASRRDELLDRVRRRLARVHQLIWRPLEARVRAFRGLIVVPHGVLHGVPFVALDDGRGALLDQHDIGLAPNAASLVQRAPTRDGMVLLLGDTRRLAHVQAELDAARAAWPGALVLDGSAGGDGDAAALARHAPQASVLHLACHASFRPDNARFSWLQVGGGRVLACDIESWRLSAATVVLSGCETAVADPDAGDEALGLVRAFLMAGAARVVGSLWPVEDGSTAALMSAFHAGLVAGGSAAAALHDAQRKVRAGRDDPYHWAGFMVHGGL